MHLRSGSSRTEKLPYSRSIPFSGLRSFVDSHMFLYKCLSSSLKSPGVIHNIFQQSLTSHTSAVPSYSLSLNRIMATLSRQQPMWHQPIAPNDAALPALSIYNSLTKKKEPFVPLDWGNRKVKWYACGMCISTKFLLQGEYNLTTYVGVTPYDDAVSLLSLKLSVSAVY